mmetsp:Transcript_2952/g.6854  ORF Transcript_2952/g.6854 Transcript_2952/m.6854 type:complete len:200 (+) Transcript_2952:469-1068(+)
MVGVALQPPLGPLVPHLADALHTGGCLEAPDVDVLHALPALNLPLVSVSLKTEAAQNRGALCDFPGEVELESVREHSYHQDGVSGEVGNGVDEGLVVHGLGRVVSRELQVSPQAQHGYQQSQQTREESRGFAGRSVLGFVRVAVDGSLVVLVFESGACQDAREAVHVPKVGQGAGHSTYCKSGTVSVHFGHFPLMRRLL